VLHDRHYLYRVVSLLYNPWYHIPSKFQVGANATFLGTNSNMTFINSKTLWFLWFGMFELVCLERKHYKSLCHMPEVLLVIIIQYIFWMPYTLFVSSPFRFIRFLCYISCPGTQSFKKLIIMTFDNELYFRVVLQRTTAICIRRQMQFPLAIF